MRFSELLNLLDPFVLRFKGAANHGKTHLVYVDDVVDWTENDVHKLEHADESAYDNEQIRQERQDSQCVGTFLDVIVQFGRASVQRRGGPASRSGDPVSGHVVGSPTCCSIVPTGWVGTPTTGWVGSVVRCHRYSEHSWPLRSP